MAKKRVRRSKLVSHRKNKDFSSLLGDSLNEFGVKFVTILKTFLAELRLCLKSFQNFYLEIENFRYENYFVGDLSLQD